MTPRTDATPRIPKSIWALGFVNLLMDVSSELIHSLVAVIPAFLAVVLLFFGVQKSPCDSSAYAFHNNRRTRIKLLVWDGTGV